MNPLYEGGQKEMFKFFKEVLSIDAKNKGGDAEAHDIMYGKWHDTNRT